jgi:formylglycine-generating enzyme required for sulfatase activity
LQPVAQLLPNPFGLFDLHGNAMELCLVELKASPISGSISYSRRGGSYIFSYQTMTSDWAAQRELRPALSASLGFRVVRTLVPSGTAK